MPCQDQTERLELLLDEQDQILDFRLHKISCGKPVGENDLLPHVQGQPATELLQLDLSDIIDISSLPPLDLFLLNKQLFSIRAAVGVWSGSASGLMHDPFTLDELIFEADKTIISGIISVDLIQAEIKACASCSSCAVSSNPAAQQRIAAKQERLQSQQTRTQEILSSILQEHHNPANTPTHDAQKRG